MASLENFIELTNQIFWEGYAEQLAKEKPAAFQFEFAEFMNLYNSENHVRYHISAYQSDHTDYA